MEVNDLSPAFREAMELLGQSPLPADAQRRLEQLEQRIRPDEADAFAELWEAYTVAGGAPPK